MPLIPVFFIHPVYFLNFGNIVLYFRLKTEESKMAGMMLKMMNPMGSMPVSRSRSEKISYMVHNPISRSVLSAARGRNILKIAGLRNRLDLSRIQIRPPRKKNRIRIPLHEHQIWIRIRPYKLNFCISK